MRNENMDALKGFGILLVVIGHVCTEMTGLVHWIYSFHMPLFFMISGYIEEEKMVNSNVGILKYIMRKAKSLLYPYLIFSFIASIGSLIVLAYSKRWDVLWKTVYMRVFGIRITENHIGAIWFLMVLFSAEVMAFYLKKRNKEWVICLVALIGSCLAVFDKNYQLPFLLEDAFLAVMFVYIGKLFKRYNWGSIILGKKYVPRVLFLLFFMVTIQLYAAMKNAKVDIYSLECGNIFLFWIASILGGATFILFFNYIGEKYKWHILNRIGKESLVIMATHWYINTVLCIILSYFFDLSYVLDRKIFMILWSIILTVICFLASLFIKRFLPFLIICPYHKNK